MFDDFTNKDSLSYKINNSDFAAGYVPPTSDYQLSPEAQNQMAMYNKAQNEAPAIDPNEILSYQKMSLDRPTIQGYVNTGGLNMPIIVNPAAIAPSNIIEARKGALQKQAQEKLKSDAAFNKAMESPVISDPFINQNFKKDFKSGQDYFMKKAQDTYGKDWQYALTQLDRNKKGSLANDYYNFVDNANLVADNYQWVVDKTMKAQDLVREGKSDQSKEDYQAGLDFLNAIDGEGSFLKSQNLREKGNIMEAKYGNRMAFNDLKGHLKATDITKLGESISLGGTQKGWKVTNKKELSYAIANEFVKNYTKNIPNWNGDEEALTKMMQANVESNFSEELTKSWDTYHAPTKSENETPANYQGVTPQANRSIPFYDEASGKTIDGIESVSNIISVSDLGAGGVGNKIMTRPVTFYDKTGKLTQNTGNLSIEPIDVYERSYVGPDGKTVYVPFLNAQRDVPYDDGGGVTKYNREQIQIPLSEELKKQLAVNSKTFNYATKNNPGLYKTRSEGKKEEQTYNVAGVNKTKAQLLEMTNLSTGKKFTEAEFNQYYGK